MVPVSILSQSGRPLIPTMTEIGNASRCRGDNFTTKWFLYTSPFSQTLIYDMEDNEGIGATPETDNGNNVETNDQQDSDNKSGPLETIKTVAQVICGMILKLAVCFGIVAVICVITGVSVTKLRP